MGQCHEITNDAGCVVAKVTGESPHQKECEEGVWVELVTADGKQPTIALIKEGPEGYFPGQVYIGIYQDTKNVGIGCDLAVSFCPTEGPILQVKRGKDVRFVNLFDLISSMGVSYIPDYAKRREDLKDPVLCDDGSCPQGDNDGSDSVG